MALEFGRFVHKPLFVDAIEVTITNMVEVAEWCNGRILVDTETGVPKSYIRVKVSNPSNVRRSQAFPGDMVLKAGSSFKVFTRSAFEKSFLPTNETLEEPSQTAVEFVSPLG